jgi:hypothetical protein
MTNVSSLKELQYQIEILERRRIEDAKALRESLLQAYESIKPMNVIKRTIKEAILSSEIQGNVVDVSIGLAAGYVSKRVFEGATHSPVRKLLGTLLMFGVTKLLSKSPGIVQRARHGISSIAERLTATGQAARDS